MALRLSFSFVICLFISRYLCRLLSCSPSLDIPSFVSSVLWFYYVHCTITIIPFVTCFRFCCIPYTVIVRRPVLLGLLASFLLSILFYFCGVESMCLVPFFSPNLLGELYSHTLFVWRASVSSHVIVCNILCLGYMMGLFFRDLQDFLLLFLFIPYLFRLT